MGFRKNVQSCPESIVILHVENNYNKRLFGQFIYRMKHLVLIIIGFILLLYFLKNNIIENFQLRVI